MACCSVLVIAVLLFPPAYSNAREAHGVCIHGLVFAILHCLESLL